MFGVLEANTTYLRQGQALQLHTSYLIRTKRGSAKKSVENFPRLNAQRLHLILLRTKRRSIKRTWRICCANSP